jgi:hypothetical protein
MPHVADLTVVVCGPVARRAPLMVDLERAGATLEPDQGARGHHWGFADLRDDPTFGTVACRHGDLNRVAEIAGRAGWQLRMHWQTPDCPVCDGAGRTSVGTAGLGVCLHCDGIGRTNRPAKHAEQLLREELDGLRAEVAALKAGR